MKASLTIESSVVFPISIFVSILLILYSFFIHDIVVVRSDMYRILMENHCRNDDDADVYDICARLEDKCLLTHNFTAKYEDQSNTLRLSDSTSSDWFSLTANVSFSGYKRCDFIRQYYTLVHHIIKLSN